MDDIFAHQVFVPFQYLFHDLNCPVLRDKLLKSDELLEVPMWTVFKYQIVIELGLENVEALNDVGVVE